LRIKLKDRRFDTIDVIDTEKRAVLKNPEERDSQDAFKMRKKGGERCTLA
jgi:hypothetical protein